MSTGRISQIIGPVLDITFPEGALPNLLNALVIQGKNAAGNQVVRVVIS